MTPPIAVGQKPADPLQDSSSPYDAARRILLGPPPWLLETYALKGRVLEGVGWALPGYEEPDDYTLVVNGRVPQDLRMGMPSPDLAKVFPFFESSTRARFRFSCSLSDEEMTQGFAEIAYSNAYTRDPLYYWHNTFVPLTSSSAALPDDEQLMRTQGNKSRERFVAYGFTTFKRIEGLLQTYFQRDLTTSYRSILDWGCGCGRVARHLVEQCKGQVVGCDIDAANVQWCADHLRGGRFISSPLMPPLAAADGSFDLIIGISVLTHLPKEAEVAWAREIHRILSPGGVALMTVHSNSGIARILDDARLAAVLKEGRADSDRDNRLDAVIADKTYYRATFHTPSAAAALFDGMLTHVATVPAANALLQDFLVLRKPG